MCLFTHDSYEPILTYSGRISISVYLNLDVIFSAAQIALTFMEPPSMSELGSVTTCVDEQLCFRLGFANDSTVTKGPGRQCVITVQTVDGSAVGQSLMTITILNVIINVKCIYMWSLYGMYT